MTQHENYATAGRDFLAKAQEALAQGDLAQGDLAQASEKGWGAAAQMVKAVAQRRGWDHNGHALLFQVVRQLAEETGDVQINELFHFANSLHSNFYENWMYAEMVQSGLDNVGRLVAKLEPLLR